MGTSQFLYQLKVNANIHFIMISYSNLILRDIYIQTPHENTNIR